MIDLSPQMQQALNNQISYEGYASNFYLALAYWSDDQALEGCKKFFMRQSDEERLHMLKLIRFINDRGGKAIIPKLDQPATNHKNLQGIFKTLLDHETMVTQEINNVVDICLKEKDYTTHNFMQWYVAEQIEEETLARNLMDKLKLAGNDNGALYLFDRDLGTLTPQESGK